MTAKQFSLRGRFAVRGSGLLFRMSSSNSVCMHTQPRATKQRDHSSHVIHCAIGGNCLSKVVTSRKYRLSNPLIRVGWLISPSETVQVQSVIFSAQQVGYEWIQKPGNRGTDLRRFFRGTNRVPLIKRPRLWEATLFQVIDCENDTVYLIGFSHRGSLLCPF